MASKRALTDAEVREYLKSIGVEKAKDLAKDAGVKFGGGGQTIEEGYEGLYDDETVTAVEKAKPANVLILAAALNDLHFPARVSGKGKRGVEFFDHVRTIVPEFRARCDFGWRDSNRDSYRQTVEVKDAKTGKVHREERFLAPYHTYATGLEDIARSRLFGRKGVKAGEPWTENQRIRIAVAVKHLQSLVDHEDEAIAAIAQMGLAAAGFPV